MKWLFKLIFNHENLWVVLIAMLLLLILLFGTMGPQPKFVYGGF